MEIAVGTKTLAAFLKSKANFFCLDLWKHFPGELTESANDCVLSQSDTNSIPSNTISVIDEDKPSSLTSTKDFRNQ